MAEEKKEGQETETKSTVSITEFNELKEQYAQLKSIQSGETKKTADALKLAEAERSEKEAIKKQAELDKLSEAERVKLDIAELKRLNVEKDQKAAFQSFINSGYKLAGEKGLKPKYVDNYTGERDIEKLAKYLDSVNEDFAELKTKTANELLTTGGHIPKSGNDGDPAKWDDSKHNRQENEAHYSKFIYGE